MPTSTNTPVPTETNTPVPTSTNTPVPTATETPTPTPTFGEITPPPVEAPDVSINKTHTGQFLPGGTGIFTLSVLNAGAAATSFPIFVTDELPFPLTLNGMPSGLGWDCSASTSTMVNCVNNTVLGVGQSLPNITVPVNIGQTDLRRIENTARVTTQNDSNPDNDSSTDIVFLQPSTRTAPSVSALGGLLSVLTLLGLGFFRLRRGLGRP